MTDQQLEAIRHANQILNDAGLLTYTDVAAKLNRIGAALARSTGGWAQILTAETNKRELKNRIAKQLDDLRWKIAQLEQLGRQLPRRQHDDATAPE